MARLRLALPIALALALLSPAAAGARRVRTYWVLSTSGSLKATNDRQETVYDDADQPDTSHVEVSFKWRSVKPPSYSGYPTLTVPFGGSVNPIERFAADRAYRATLTYRASGRRWVIDHTGGGGDHYADWTCKPRTVHLRQDALVFPIARGSVYDLGVFGLSGFFFKPRGCTSSTGEPGSLPQGVDFTGVRDALLFQKRLTRRTLRARRSTLRMKLSGRPLDCHEIADIPSCTVTASGHATVALHKQCKIAAIQRGDYGECNDTYNQPPLR